MSQKNSIPNFQGDISLAIFNAIRGKCKCKVCKPTQELMKITDPKLKIKAIKAIVTTALKEPAECDLGLFFQTNLPIMQEWVNSGKKS